MTAATVVNIPNYTIGSDAITTMPRIARKYGDRVLVIGGKTALERSEEKIERALKASGETEFHFNWYGGECTYNNMENLVQEVERRKSNLILGVGGGKAIDTAKGVAEKEDLPVITIPSIPPVSSCPSPLSTVSCAGIKSTLSFTRTITKRSTKTIPS